MFLTCASVKVQCAKKFMTIIHMSDFTLPPSAWWTGSTSFELEAQEAIATSEASARLVLTKFRRKVRKRELCGEDAALHFIAPQIRPSVPAQVRLTRAADARSARRSVCGDGKPQSWPPGWDPLSGDPRYMTWPSRIRRGGGGGWSSSPVIDLFSLCAQQQWMKPWRARVSASLSIKKPYKWLLIKVNRRTSWTVKQLEEVLPLI